MDAERFDTLLATLAAAPSRRAALRALGGLGLAGLFGQTAAKTKHKKKKCAKAGQATSKKRKKCCTGLGKDATGRCAPRASGGCTPATCPAKPAAACRMAVAGRSAVAARPTRFACAVTSASRVPSPARAIP